MGERNWVFSHSFSLVMQTCNLLCQSGLPCPHAPSNHNLEKSVLILSTGRQNKTSGNQHKVILVPKLLYINIPRNYIFIKAIILVLRKLKELKISCFLKCVGLILASKQPASYQERTLNLT